ncbi:5'-nucleotidase C-terminal domain-containing protein [Fervidobacterium sp.]
MRAVKFILVILAITAHSLLVAQGNIASVTIVHTANIYGNVLPYNYFSDMYESKGLVHIATYVKELRTANPNTLVIDTGNLLLGSPFGDYFVQNSASENPLFLLFNQIGYDVFVPGTFEMGLGKERLLEISKNIKSFVLATNLTQSVSTAKTFYVKVLDNGVKVATLGVVPPSENYVSQNYITMLKNKIEQVKKEHSPDIIILATSGGITFDPLTNNPISIKSNFNIGDILVKEFYKDVDVFLFGNQAVVYTGMREKKVFSIPGSEGASLNRIDVSLIKSGKSWRITNIAIQNIPMTQVKPSPIILDWIQQYEPQVQKWLSTPVLKSPVTVGFNKYMALLEDSLITEFVNKEIIRYSKADLGIWNIFNPTFKGIVEGDVTRQDIYSMIGKTTTVKVIQLSGMQIKDIMQRNLSLLHFKDGKVIFSKALVSAPWLYDLFENIEYEVVLNKQNIRRISFAGKPLEENKKFLVSLPSIRTYGKNAILIGTVVKEIEVPVQNIIFNQVKDTEMLYEFEDRNRVSSVLLKYTVQPGDAFRKVAYRLGISEDELLELNPIIKDPNLLRPGWELIYYKKYLDLIPPLKELFEAK